ncbi:DUF5655 domain-containing protein [Mucilaginibacter ginsenosidivorax]|uniref:DUF5655 domain-containing protein n=1 Tax=Mucilaginibacter ginsenosidivorax TaxID=862126 RepID=A0A5B8W1Q6_9SPHI|nr:DUF5655 domain-containing protein [Mucilaginibacter ginsenosidivorax]QEC77814.1 hypothetical protein FSB76_18410 [Mucilaginibacter ginsenosidivorax]
MSWTCPKCERELPKPEQRHYCARVSLDSLLGGRPPELVLVFDKILAEVAGWEDVLVGTTPNCIVFTRRLTFLVIRPMKKELDIKFYSKMGHTEKPVLKSVAVGNKFENHIRIALLDELHPKLFTYLRESYELL